LWSAPPRNPPLDRSYFVKTEVAPCLSAEWAIGLEDRPRPQCALRRSRQHSGCAEQANELTKVSYFFSSKEGFLVSLQLVTVITAWVPSTVAATKSLFD